MVEMVLKNFDEDIEENNLPSLDLEFYNEQELKSIHEKKS